MATVKAFKALRYTDGSNLEKLVTPPYDIISEKQQEKYYNSHENNVIRLEYGKIFDTDNENDNRYTRAGEFLKKFKDNGILKTDEKNAFYIYEEKFEIKGETKSFKGIFSRVKLEEFEKKIVLPHEETLSKAKGDRFSLMEKTDCNFSPIYMMYMDKKKQIVKIINEETQRNPDISFDFEDVTQNLWVMTDCEKISKTESLFSDKQLFIADGHHRYETALNYRNKKRNESTDFKGDEGFEYVMSFLVEMDDDGLVVFPTHRMLKNLENFNENEIAEKLKENFYVEKTDNLNIEEEIKSDDRKIFAFYTGKDYFYKLTLKNEDAVKAYIPHKSDAYRSLDVSVLHSLILEKYFGIDKENMANQKNLVYTRELKEAVESVRTGEYRCSFIINATKISQIKEVSLNNEKIPQKSTYFWPKLVTGIVMNDLNT